MKTLTPIARTVIFFALVLIGALAIQPAFAATTIYMDVNGTSPGFWSIANNPVSVSTTGTNTWTTDTTGVAAPTAGNDADNFQFGVNPGDLNGATISFNTLADTLSGTNFAIDSTNCTVTWITTGNSHFNSSPTTIFVTNGSTLVWNTTANNGGYNFNGKNINFTGGGTNIFLTGFLANGQAGANVMNMPGGTIILKQTAKSNYGDTTGASFTLTNGTLAFGNQSALANAFAQFTNATDVIHINGGAIDNTSGSSGTLVVGTTVPSTLGAGQYTIGGNFTFVGSSPLSLGSNVVTLQASPTITVLANTLTIGGPISGAFGITNAGPGTLALTNANTYTGATVVNDGTVIASTLSTGAGGYTVADNAALDVFVDNVGQTLSMSNLTVGSVTGGTLEFDLGAFANPNSAATAPVQLGATGALTVNGATTPIDFVSIAPITNFPVVIPLIHYGTASGNLGGLTTGTFPSLPIPYQGYISNDTVDSLIDLVLTNGFVQQPPGPAKTDTWIGQISGVANGNWDTTTTNWSNAGNATNYANLTTTGGGDNVIFDDTLAGTSTINLTRALNPATITMNNNNSNYVFVGSGKITGSTALTMNGTGQLTFDNSTNDDFSGNIVINSGTLQIGNNDGNGGIGSGLITNNSTLIFARSDTNLMVNQIISGTGALTNNGTGTVTLGSPETLTGPVVVNAGTLAFNGPNSNAGGVSQSTNVIINSGGTVIALGDNAFVGQGLAPITILANGLLTGNTTSSHIDGQVTLLGGIIAMGGSGPFSTSFGTWSLQGTPVALTVPGTNVTSVISAQNMVPAQTSGTIFNVTNGSTPSGIDLLVSGTFINGSSLNDTGIIKNGNGLMVLDGNNGYAHGTTVNGGPLQLGMPTDTAIITALGTGTLNLDTGSTLTFDSGAGVSIPGVIADDGSGTVVTLNSGTNIFSGNNTYSGKTIVNAGKLVLTNGATINSSASISVSSATLDLSNGGAMNNGSGALSVTSGSLNLGTNLISNIGTFGVTNATMNFQVFPADQNTVNITVSSGFSTGGSTNVINLSAVPGYLGYPTNISLIKYGTFAGVGGNNNLTTLGVILPAQGQPTGYLTNDVNNQSIDLVLLSDTNYPIMPLIWKGQLSANWDVLTTSNWVLAADGVTPFAFQSSDPLTFDDTATGLTSVIVTTNVSPGIVTLNNSAKAYVFSGPGKISGNAALTLANNGPVTLGDAGGDSFSGGIQVNGGSTLLLTNSNVSIGGGITINNGSFTDQHSGTISGGLIVNGANNVLLDQPGTITGGGNLNVPVQVGNNDTNGSIPIGGVTNNVAIVFDRIGTNGTVIASVSGSGSVTNNNTGTINWFATNSYTGPTVLNAGIFITSGGNQAVSGFHGSSQLIINSGAQVQVAVDNSLSGRGSINILPILVNAGGILTGAPGADTGAGTSTHLQGLLTLNGGILTNSGTSINAANGSWDLDDGVATAGGPITSIIGCYSVAPTQNSGSGVQFNVVAGNTPGGIDLDVTGTIIRATSQSDYGIDKIGNGVLRLSNTNTFTGTNNNNVALTISDGVVIANAKETPGTSGPLGRTATSTGPAYIVFSGGTLQYSAVNNFDYSYRFQQGDPISINTAGTNVTFATGFTFGSSVTKLGAGTLTLASTTNSYSGATTVAGGTLITTTTATGAGSYAVTNGGILDVQVAAPGGQLAMSSLTLGGGASDTSELQIDTLTTGNPTVAPINAEAGITTNGTVNIKLSGLTLTAGTVPLIAYTGPSPSGLLNFIPPPGFTGTLSDNGSVISVTLVGAELPTRSASITKVFLSGANLIIQGTNNNTPNTNFHYEVLSSTNVATPLSSWTVIATNGFNANGTFDYTNPIVPGTPQQYIDVKAVP